jgi:hypothetical protein
MRLNAFTGSRRLSAGFRANGIKGPVISARPFDKDLAEFLDRVDNLLVIRRRDAARCDVPDEYQTLLRQFYVFVPLFSPIPVTKTRTIA